MARQSNRDHYAGPLAHPAVSGRRRIGDPPPEGDDGEARGRGYATEAKGVFISDRRAMIGLLIVSTVSLVLSCAALWVSIHG